MNLPLSRILLSLALIVSLFSLGFRSYQQTGVDYVDISQEWDFGEEIRFQGAIQSPSRITESVLFIRPFGADTRLIDFKTGPGGVIDQTYNLSDSLLGAFTPVEYWYQVKLDTGEESSSPVYSFLYEDNRFDWQRMESDKFKLAWASGDLEFGQTLMNAAEDSLVAAQSILPVDSAPPLRIYVYPSASELQSAISLGSLPWAAGHANPDIGVILISITPGPDARAEMERQLPHEIMHILEYQVTGASYNRVPMWLLEGLASFAELYPNPDYQRVLQNAVETESLVPMVVYCDSFPRDLSGAMHAYAQSSSFVRFLHQNYGSTGITSLLTQYKDGFSCEAGVQEALGTSLSEIEGRWQTETLGHNANLAAWKQIRPYLLLALIILIPVGLSFLPRRANKKKNGNKSNVRA